jgi:hypothetical protein
MGELPRQNWNPPDRRLTANDYRGECRTIVEPHGQPTRPPAPSRRTREGEVTGEQTHLFGHALKLSAAFRAGNGTIGPFAALIPLPISALPASIPFPDPFSAVAAANQQIIGPWPVLAGLLCLFLLIAVL